MKMDLKDATADDILHLNLYQTSGTFHPFTCPNRNDGGHREFNGDLGALVATKRGWVCPWCDYTQQWAHTFMASEVLVENRVSTTQEQLIAVGRALLPYLRNDLTDVELGRAAHDAAAAVKKTT